MPVTPLTLRAHFDALDTLLSNLRDYWQFQPFEHRTLPWSSQPALHRWLQQLNQQQCDTLATCHDDRVAALSPFIPAARQIERLSRLPAPPATPAGSLPARLGYHIPGRKWEQIRAFDHALIDARAPFLEWCAGKGHLGRLLAFNRHQPVTSLEWQQQLCEDGQRLADTLELPCEMVPTDVLAATSDRHLLPHQHAVALHACGELHLRLLKQACQIGVQAISLSPCCYQRIDETRYQPLSEAAAASPLRLSRDDLKLSLQDTVTAGHRERRMRDQELCWRLGFDLLQRQLRDDDSYLNCPSVPKGLLSGSFEDFCRWMAQRKQLPLTRQLDYQEFERRGQRRLVDIRRMEVVRHLFRRPLEIWLALDRALFLEEQGYEVQLSQFCDYQLTPRNLLIQAIKPAEPARPAVSPGR